ncbi:4-oxalomesaconate tautomerase [Kutzneria sp. NPDC051319]|uniref:4-oxalomesaconate tautomerase n=1 Tax=Kutzneria sp. NPDC051319 TaxID=3155047 RepID=UPI0034434F33
MTGIRCMLMRGGTSKGAYFLAEDIPAVPSQRDELLLSVMGSPDPRQIDGIGGAHPLTSKVAVVSPSAAPGVDVDYLFLQIGVGEATVSDQQNCGNLLAGVGPFAVERGLVAAGVEQTTVRIRLVNTNSHAVARFPTPGGVVDYSGGTAISGVPGSAAPVVLDLADTEGSAGHGLLPTGNLVDVIDGVRVTCVDNGMLVVVANAGDLGVTGHESVAELQADGALLARIQSLRVQAGALMGFGDVTDTLMPKTTLVAPPVDGGTISTRTFMPLLPHDSVGVLGAVSVATAVLLDGAVGHDVAGLDGDQNQIDIEHPAGHLHVEVDLDASSDRPRVRRSGVVRTARKLFDGTAFPR